jgi:hypothetical protein
MLIKNYLLNFYRIESLVINSLLNFQSVEGHRGKETETEMEMNKKKMEGLREEQKTKKRSLEASGSLGFGLPSTAPSAESPISPSLSVCLSVTFSFSERQTRSEKITMNRYVPHLLPSSLSFIFG